MLNASKNDKMLNVGLKSTILLTASHLNFILLNGILLTVIFSKLPYANLKNAILLYVSEKGWIV